jgi:hypothetical protein
MNFNNFAQEDIPHSTWMKELHKTMSEEKGLRECQKIEE